MLKLILGTFLFFTVSISTTSGQLKLYSHPGCQGFFADIEKTPSLGLEIDLKDYKFDNVAQSVRGGENWIFFDSADRDGRDGIEVVNTRKIANQCYNFGLLKQRVSKLRAVGQTNNARKRIAVLEFYPELSFSGEMSSIQGLANSGLPSKISSIVLSGSMPWTLYGKPNMAGPAICIYPYDQTGSVSTFIPDLTQLDPPIASDFIKSARPGCTL